MRCSRSWCRRGDFSPLVSVVADLKTCNSLFFEDGSGPLEQTARLLVSVVTFLMPNWAVLYVFYLLPRFQFATTLDVPDLGVGYDGVSSSPGDDEAAYYLLGKEDLS